MRILLVEDDDMIGQAVQEALESNAYAVDWVQDGARALDAISEVPYDCALLDLGLPKVDGIKVLEYWRSQKIKTPVIILTARDELPDRVLGLDKGADDYIVKPFEMQELLARLRAVTRRLLGDNADSIMTYGCLSLNPLKHEVYIKTGRGNMEIELTAREFALLETLMMRPGAVFSRDALEQRIYSWNDEIESNAVEYIIYSLRRKIGASFIKNVRGVGWKVNKIDDPTLVSSDGGAKD
ncbi:MAG TPA: response regulator transcription factor [Candidatus Anaerobiospirillum pullistercoris]|uniref:Response regulator transcription factor n=1 Tax=Candidatus Anaerobiospirillum pullistercoris TaxID=2838452 RepID=A0A9D1WDP5_9GAMM|nr:response regulator transcription factor [Candidatus Anaerobiospirillum pullistercoris]